MLFTRTSLPLPNTIPSCPPQTIPQMLRRILHQHAPNIAAPLSPSIGILLPIPTTPILLPLLHTPPPAVPITNPLQVPSSAPMLLTGAYLRSAPLNSSSHSNSHPHLSLPALRWPLLSSPLLRQHLVVRMTTPNARPRQRCSTHNPNSYLQSKETKPVSRPPPADAHPP